MPPERALAAARCIGTFLSAAGETPDGPEISREGWKSAIPAAGRRQAWAGDLEEKFFLPLYLRRCKSRFAQEANCAQLKFVRRSRHDGVCWRRLETHEERQPPSSLTAHSNCTCRVKPDGAIAVLPLARGEAVCAQIRCGLPNEFGHFLLFIFGVRSQTLSSVTSKVDRQTRVRDDIAGANAQAVGARSPGGLQPIEPRKPV